MCYWVIRTTWRLSQNPLLQGKPYKQCSTSPDIQIRDDSTVPKDKPHGLTTVPVMPISPVAPARRPCYCICLTHRANRRHRWMPAPANADPPNRIQTPEHTVYTTLWHVRRQHEGPFFWRNQPKTRVLSDSCRLWLDRPHNAAIQSP